MRDNLDIIDHITNNKVVFTMEHGRKPTHVLIHPREHAKLKVKFGTPLGVANIMGLDVIITSNFNLSMKVCLL